MPDFGAFLKNQDVNGLLFIGNSLCDSDMFYLSRFLAGDRFAILVKNGVCLLVSSMEMGRAEKESSADEVLSTMHYSLKEKLKIFGNYEDAYLHMLKEFLNGHNIERLGVPFDFPCKVYNYLLNDFQVKMIESPISRWRAIKNHEEIESIRRVQEACQDAMQLAVKLISKAEPVGDNLFWRGEQLTSDRVREIIEMKLLKKNCEATGTIVAGGPQSAIPHAQGTGPLPAHVPIVIDIFPRSKKTRYFADMSRTFVQGEATAEIKDLYDAVLDAQITGINAIRAGVSGKDVHSQVIETFNSRGYTERNGRGFMHSTGHGIGLDVHERPSLNETGEILEANNIVTVEPGLYYPEIGGIRLEDLVVVGEKGCYNLTSFEKRLEI